MQHIDCDTDDDIPTKYGVRNLPTLVFLDGDDQVIKRHVGVTTLAHLYEILDEIEGKQSIGSDSDRNV